MGFLCRANHDKKYSNSILVKNNEGVNEIKFNKDFNEYFLKFMHMRLPYTKNNVRTHVGFSPPLTFDYFSKIHANMFNAAFVLFTKAYKLLFHYLHILQELFHQLETLYFHKPLCLVF